MRRRIKIVLYECFNNHKIIRRLLKGVWTKVRVIDWWDEKRFADIWLWDGHNADFAFELTDKGKVLFLEMETYNDSRILSKTRRC